MCECDSRESGNLLMLREIEFRDRKVCFGAAHILAKIAPASAGDSQAEAGATADL
jgi:hypothetical protein